MNFSPNSPADKVLQAVFVWLFACLACIPLWEIAMWLPYCLWPLSALLELHLCPMGIAMIITISLHEEDWSVVSRYWPAILIASVFTAWFLNGLWRQG